MSCANLLGRLEDPRKQRSAEELKTKYWLSWCWRQANLVLQGWASMIRACETTSKKNLRIIRQREFVRIQAAWR
jgi:hypothetical protein